MGDYMKKIICLLLILLLCGCDQSVSNNTLATSDFFEIENYNIIVNKFDKEFIFPLPYSEVNGYYDEANEMFELRFINPTTSQHYLVRVKKAEAYEDILNDLDIKYDSQTEITNKLLNGIKGEGQIKLKYIGKNYLPFNSETWFDADDKMVYSLVAIGEDTTLFEPYNIFNPHQFIEIDINSYAEGIEFLSKYGDNGYYQMSTDDEHRTSIQHEQDDCIVIFIYNSNIEEVRWFYPNGDARYNTITTDTETGNYTEVDESFFNDEHTINTIEYTKDNQCTSLYFENLTSGYIAKTEFNLEGEITYEYENDNRHIKEIVYTGNTGYADFFYKHDSSNSHVTFKKLNVDGYERRYYLTIDCDYYSSVFTYASEDSAILTKYEILDKQDGEHAIWTFNGNSNDYSDMITLVRTFNGVTTTYTYDTVPWGTAIRYAPDDPGDFYF